MSKELSWRSPRAHTRALNLASEGRQVQEEPLTNTSVTSRRAPKRSGVASRASALQHPVVIAPPPRGIGLQPVTASTIRCCSQVVPARHHIVNAPKGLTGLYSNSGRVRSAAAEDSSARSIELHSLCRDTVLRCRRMVSLQVDAAAATRYRRRKVGGPT
nr:hypothetical protein CFP56_73356 [Quercus suber]